MVGYSHANSPKHGEKMKIDEMFDEDSPWVEGECKYCDLPFEFYCYGEPHNDGCETYE